MADDDVLPGLDELAQRLDAVLGPAREPVSLVVLDPDDLKRVNVIAGFERGDAVLAEVARRLRAAGGPVHTLCRVGSRFFAVLCVSTGEAAAWARLVLDGIAAEPLLRADPPIVTSEADRAAGVGWCDLFGPLADGSYYVGGKRYGGPWPRVGLDAVRDDVTIRGIVVSAKAGVATTIGGAWEDLARRAENAMHQALADGDFVGGTLGIAP